MTVDELKSEALRLAPQVRAELARELLHSLDDLSQAEVDLARGFPTSACGGRGDGRR